MGVVEVEVPFDDELTLRMRRVRTPDPAIIRGLAMLPDGQAPTRLRMQRLSSAAMAVDGGDADDLAVAEARLAASQQRAEAELKGAVLIRIKRADRQGGRQIRRRIWHGQHTWLLAGHRHDRGV